MVKIKKDEIINALILEGFRRVKFENKKAYQIGSGFAKKLRKPWEMHVQALGHSTTGSYRPSGRG